MLALTLQTLLLLLLAYFTGALLACLLRRLFAGRQPALAPAAGVSRPAVALARTGVEVPRPPYVGPSAAPAIDAFRRSEPEQIAARVAAPEPRPVELVVEPPPPNPAKVIADAAAVAAAAAAVVAARKASTPPAAEARTVVAQAAGASGRSVAVADIALAAAPKAAPGATAPADDFRRIRAIDADIAGRLERLGVHRFADIAAWSATDVQRISRELGFKGRIAKENWIEQAQILAKGSETHYALRAGRGERATAEPSADMWTSRPSVRPVVRVETPSVAPPAAPPLTAASPPAAQPAAGPQPSAFGRPPAGGAGGSPAAAPSTPRVSDLAAFARTGDATAPRAVPAAPPAAQASPPQAGVRVPSAAPPLPPTLPPDVPPPARAAPPLPPAAPPAARDRLVRIRGITADAEKQLNLAGVTRFAQIAAWTRTDVERFERQLAHEGRIQRENWVEQAQILAKGGETAFSRELDRSSDVAAAGQPPPSPAENRGRPDLSSLRSVRSEAFRQEGETRAATGNRVVRSGAPDDLKRIRGVGVLIEKKLNAMGIIRYEQIANWTSADIASVSQALDFKGRIERESWVEQARILQAGGQTEFSRRVDRGEIK